MLDLARAKAHLRIEADTADEDALVSAYLAAAVSHVENVTGHLLTQQTVVQRIASARIRGSLRLFRSPVRSVTSVTYVAVNGTAGVIADHRFVEGTMSVLLPALGSDWPPVERDHPAALTVTYQAGYSPAEVPMALEQAVLMLVGHNYLHREVAVMGTLTTLPMAVDALLAPYRPIGMA